MIDAKTLQTLEFHKILERLARYCAFPASVEKARQLLPTSDIAEARLRQAATREAYRLLATHADLTIGGARDVREAVDLANHGGILLSNDLLDIKSTLIAARNLVRLFERLGGQFPILTEIALRLPPPLGLIDSITRTSRNLARSWIPLRKLGNIRRARRPRAPAHQVQRMVGDPKNAPYFKRLLPSVMAAMCSRCAPNSRVVSNPSSTTNPRLAPPCL
jgi:hypothetical protein